MDAVGVELGPGMGHLLVGVAQGLLQALELQGGDFVPAGAGDAFPFQGGGGLPVHGFLPDFLSL